MNADNKRLEALQQYEILDTPPEDTFDNLAKLAALICDTSSAQINFIDKNRQWSKANVGWGKSELPLEMSFCVQTIQKKDSFLIVPDSLKDQHFKDNSLVKSEPPLRFYAGVSIKGEKGLPLGTICVFDSKPKDLSDQQLEALKILAEEVEAHLKLRLGHDKLKAIFTQENRLNQKIISSLPANFFMYNSEGELVRWNENILKTTGYSEKEIQQMKPTDYFSEEDRSKVQKKVEEVFQGNQVVLEVDVLKKDGTTTPFVFSASRFEIDNESYLIGTGQNISDLKEAQHKLEASLKEKEILIAEIHHRVKNNLAVISGLIQLETLEPEDSKADKKLYNTMLRIHSMALIHEIMYQTQNFTHVIFDKVIDSIARNIENAVKGSGTITFINKPEAITLNVNQAIPCGMVINELLANAWKHAYPEDEKGKIEVEMSERNGTIRIRIADEGRGLPQDAGPERSDTMGFTLVHQLCRQLKADLNVNRNQGTEFIIQFEKRDIKGTGSSYSNSFPSY